MSSNTLRLVIIIKKGNRSFQMMATATGYFVIMIQLFNDDFKQ